MKNLKLKLKGLALVAVFTLSLNSAFASGLLRINKYLNTDYSIISILNSSDSNLKLRVYDEDGFVFYSETITAETSTQKLVDLSYLADGNYSLVLVGENTKVETPFVVRAKKLAVSNETMQIAKITPYLNTEYSIVSVFNTSESNLKLKVYDEAGTVFYNETIAAETTTQKLFDLSYLADGNYSLALVGDNTKVETPFVVRAKKLDVANETMQIAENRN